MSFDPSALRSGSIFSDNPNYVANWVCYINGIEVPIMGFNTTEAVWEVPTFQIHLVPDPLVQRLGYEDRVQVAIFYLDNHIDLLRKEFRLLIDGEILGYNYQTISGQRVVSYTCIGHLNIFKYLYFFFMNTLDDVVAAQDPTIQSAGLTTAGLFYPYSLFHQGLIARAQTGRYEDAAGQPTVSVDSHGARRAIQLRRGSADVEGEDDTATHDDDPIQAPFELVYNVIRGIIGTTVPVERRSIPAMNFFSRHVRKTRLHQRFVRLPILEDIANLANRTGVFPIFNAARNSEALAAMQRQTGGQIANSGSVWDILQQILSLVYMEIAMLPSAACVQTTLEGEILGPASEAQLVVQTPPAPPTTTPAAVTPPTTPLPMGPVTGIEVFRDVVNDLVAAFRTVDPSFNAQNVIGSTIDAINSGNNEDRTPLDLAERVGQILQRRNSAAVSAIGQRLDVLRNQLGTRTATVIATQRTQERQQAIEQSAQVTQQLEHARQTQENANRANQENNASRGVNPTQPLRLAQYFVKPQMLFGIPPACNIVFPSMIDQFSYSENYFDQPTRIYVNDQVMTSALRATGPQREFMLHALTVAYPEEAEAVMHHTVGDSGGDDGTLGVSGSAPNSNETGKNLLIWPEEFFKGPVVARMTLPRWFQFLQQMRNTNGETPPATTRTATTPTATNTGAASTGGSASAPTTSGGTASNATATTPGTSQAHPPGTVSGAGPAGSSDTGGPRIETLRISNNVIQGRVPYGGGMADSWAVDHAGQGIARWTGGSGLQQYKSLIQRATQIAFPGLNPLHVLGISLNGGVNENTTNFTTGLPDERQPGNPWFSIRPGGSPTIAFHEIGVFGVEGGARLGPVPNSQGNARWIQLSSNSMVHQILGRNAVTQPGSWAAFRGGLPDQIAIGVVNQRERALGQHFRPLGAAAPRNLSTTWAVALSAMAWSAGPAGAAGHVQRLLRVYPQLASVPEDRRWTAALRFLAQAYISNQIPPGTRSSHANIYFSFNRTQQKMWAGFIVGQRTGTSTTGMDVDLGAERAAVHFLINQGAYGNRLAVPTRGGIAPGSPLTANGIFEINVAPPVHRNRAPVQQLITQTQSRIEPEHRTVERITTTTTPGGVAEQHSNTATGNPNTPPADGQTVTAVQSPPIEENSEQSFQTLFRLYAQYEYLRLRYAQRNAGVTMAALNPYVVVGFPCIVFDSMRTQQHVVAYVVGKNHSAFVGPAEGTFKTSLSLSSVRTLPEFIQDVRNDCERFADVVLSAPAEIVEEIRNVIQKEEQAELFYKRLFYQNRNRVGDRKAAFIFTDALGYQDGLEAQAIQIRVEDESRTTVSTQVTNAATVTPDTIENMVIEYLRERNSLGGNLPTESQVRGAISSAIADRRNPNPNQIADQQQLHDPAASVMVDVAASTMTSMWANVSSGQAPAGIFNEMRAILQQRLAGQQLAPPTQTQNSTTTTTHRLINTLDPNIPLIPIPGSVYAEAFDNFQTAMSLCSRPICTLTEYVRFLHGGQSLTELRRQGLIEDETSAMEYGIELELDTESSLVSGAPTAGIQGSHATAVIYKRIFKLRAGPGNPPTEAERGYSIHGEITPAGPSTGVSSGYPQTRVDWDLLLVAYRDKIRNRTSPGL